jgi:hypothetical protein
MGKSEYRPLRWLETAPDNYVEFHARQRQWSFSYRHPWLWAVYRAASKARCVLLGHEWSPCIEHEKFDLERLGQSSTHCNFCGRGSPSHRSKANA